LKTFKIYPGFTIDLAHKDLTLIVNAGNAVKVPMPVAAVAREAFSTARSQGYGGKDFSSIVDVLCDIAHIEKPRLNA
jgi:4-hydroxybutyrate dehydrogenase/sulfolactaldehyde 3-reductase